MVVSYLQDLKNYDVLVFILPPHWPKIPPLSIIYLENFLRSKGVKAKAVDLNILFFQLFKNEQKDWLKLNSNFEENLFSQIKQREHILLDEIISNIVDSNAKILAFSVFARNRRTTIDFVRLLSQKEKKKLFVFGGPEILFEYFRDKFFAELQIPRSYFVLGEGELALLYLVKNKEDKFALHNNKRLISYEEIENLDELPLIDFDSLDFKSYSPKVIPLLSSRGCIKKCCFCSEYKNYSSFRQHSVSYVINQITHLKEKYKLNTFSFQDSLINSNLKWLDEFCSQIINNNIEIKWEAQIAIRPEMDIRIFLKMKESGCFNLFVGLESACDKILRDMKKGYNKNQAKIFFRKMIDANLHFEISLITGFPSETETDFQETLNFIKENKAIIPKIAQINPFVSYPPSDVNKKVDRITAISRVEKLVSLLKEERIKFTSAYINNLLSK